MKKIIYLLLFVLIASIVLAEPSFYYRKGETVDIKIPCVNNNTPCSESATCNVTIAYPNSTTFISNEQMTNQVAFFNYTLPTTDVVGEYQTIIFCQDGSNNGFSGFKFVINESGSFVNDWTFILALGITIFILGFFAIKLSQEHIILQVILFVFSFLFTLMIPAFFLLRNTKSIFYITFMSLIGLISIYILVYMIYWVMVKLKFVVPKGRKHG